MRTPPCTGCGRPATFAVVSPDTRAAEWVTFACNRHADDADPGPQFPLSDMAEVLCHFGSTPHKRQAGRLLADALLDAASAAPRRKEAPCA